MSKYSKFEVDKVKRDADIRRLIPGASEHRATQDIECPFCGKAKNFVLHTKEALTMPAAFLVSKDSLTRLMLMRTITTSI